MDSSTRYLRLETRIPTLDGKELNHHNADSQTFIRSTFHFHLSGNVSPCDIGRVAQR